MQSEFRRPFQGFRDRPQPTEQSRAEHRALTMGQWMEICHHALPIAQQDSFLQRANVATLDNSTPAKPTQVVITTLPGSKPRPGLRDAMAVQSNQLKSTWIIKSKPTYQDDCAARWTQLGQRDKSDYAEMIAWKGQKALEITTHAKDLNFHQRDEIRDIDSSRYEVDALKGRDRQTAFRKMVKEKQEKHDIALQQTVIEENKRKDQVENEIREEKNRQAHAEGDKTREKLKEKPIGLDFTFMRQEAARVRAFREELKREADDEVAEALAKKEKLKEDLDEGMREVLKEKAKNQAETEYLTRIRQDYTKQKVTEIKTIDGYKQKLRRDKVDKRQVVIDIAEEARKKREQDLLEEEKHLQQSDYQEADEKRLEAAKSKRAQMINDILEDVHNQRTAHEKRKAERIAEDHAIHDKWVKEDEIYYAKQYADQVKEKATHMAIISFREQQMEQRKSREEAEIAAGKAYMEGKRQEQLKKKPTSKNTPRKS